MIRSVSESEAAVKNLSRLRGGKTTVQLTGNTKDKFHNELKARRCGKKLPVVPPVADKLRYPSQRKSS